jgi:hypothetical protein
MRCGWQKARSSSRSPHKGILNLSRYFIAKDTIHVETISGIGVAPRASRGKDDKTMMTTLLSRSIRDAYGRPHKHHERLNYSEQIASRGFRYSAVAESAL